MSEILSHREATKAWVLLQQGGVTIDGGMEALDALWFSHEALRACLAEAEAEQVEWYQAYESADDRTKVAVMRAEAAEARLVEVEAEREAARSNVAHWSAEWSTRLRAAEARLAEVEQTLREAKEALDKTVAVLLTVKPNLDRPYPDAPTLTPWTRWCAPLARRVDDARRSARAVLDKGEPQ